MIIVPNTIENLIFEELPKTLNFSKKDFELIGCTLYLNHHFICKIFIENICHVVDNLSHTDTLSFFLIQGSFGK